MKRAHLRCLATIFFALLVISGARSSAQEIDYQRVTVAKRVSLDIPARWRAFDIDERRNLAATVKPRSDENAARQEPGHVAALAINSTPYPPGAIIRVSVVSTEELTQSDLRIALENDRVGTMKQLTTDLEEEFSTMAAQMREQGMRILGEERIAVDSIGGKLAISVTYRRTPAIGDSPFQVTQFHVPLGNEKVLITLSFRESSANVYSPILQYVKQSMAIW